MYILPLLFFFLLAQPNGAANPKVPDVPTKICADRACTVPLFNTSFTRTYKSTHEDFLSATENDEVQIVGIKYTRRTDALWGLLNGRYGFVYKGFVDPIPYVFFLEEALKANFQLYRVEHRDKDHSQKPNEVIGEVEAESEFLRDYEVNAKAADIPLNTALLERLKAKAAEAETAANHAHSHSHSHSHGHSHAGHSDHEHAGHSHEHLTEEHDHHPKGAHTSTPPTAEVPQASATASPPVEAASTAAPEDAESKTVDQPITSAPPLEQPKPQQPVDLGAQATPPPPPAPTTPMPIPVDATSTPAPQVEVEPSAPSTVVPKIVEASTPLPSMDLGPNPWTLAPLNVKTMTPPAPQVPKVDEQKINEEKPVEVKNAEAEASSVPSPPPHPPPLPVDVSPQIAATPAPLKDEIPQPPVPKSAEEFGQNATPPPPPPVQPKEAEEIPPPPPMETIVSSTVHPLEQQRQQQAQETTPPPPIVEATTTATTPPEDPHHRMDEQEVIAMESIDRPIRSAFHRAGGENSSDVADENRIFRSFMHSLRSQLPFLTGVDDTGIVVVTYFIAAVLMYFIGWLLNDRKQPDILDRRTLFESQTRIRELSVEVQQLQQQRQTPEQIAEVGKLRQRCMEQEQTIQQLRAQAIDPLVLSQKDDEIARLGREHETLLAAARSEHKAEAAAYTAEVERLKAELRAKDQEISSIEAEKDALRKAADEQTAEYAELETKYGDLAAKHDQLLQLLADQKSQAAAAGGNREECAESDGSGSGASGGWSEVGNGLDLDTELSSVEAEAKKSAAESLVERAEGESRRESKRSPPTAQKSQPPKWSPGDLEELAAARVELRKAESERDQLKRKLESAESELETLRERVREANGLKAKLEQRDEQVDGMLQMLKEKDQRLVESSDLKEEVYRLDAARERAETSAKDLEKRLQRAEETEQKLRNKWFHDERALNARIRNLEETIDKLRSNQSFDPINASSPSFSHNFSANPVADVPDLWSPFTHTNEDASFEDSDVSRNEPRRRSNRAAGTTSPGRQPPPLLGARLLPRNESFNSTNSGGQSKRNSLGGNGGLRSMIDVSADDTTGAGGHYGRDLPRGTQGRRMRSRSAGRHSVAADVASSYQAGRRSANQSGHVSPATSLLRSNNSGGSTLQRVPSASRLHNQRHTPHHQQHQQQQYQSTATNPLFGDFSSDGSNEIRSPPPELVETSGVPPPSTNFAGDLRRPTTIVRSTVPLGVRLHKPRPL